LVVPELRPPQHWVRPIPRIEPAAECRRTHGEGDCGGKEGLLREGRGDPVAQKLKDPQRNEGVSAKHSTGKPKCRSGEVRGEPERSAILKRGS
jgi:hypothetical protein